MAEYRVVVSGVGQFSTYTLEAAKHLKNWVEAYREQFEPRDHYYGDEYIYDVHIKELTVKEESIYHG